MTSQLQAAPVTDLPEQRPVQRARLWHGAVLLSGGVYFVLALWLAWLVRFYLTADGLGYVQAARNYANGSLDLAVNSWWSPLLSWLIVPLLWLGAPPILAIKLLDVVWGLGLAAGTSTLVRTLTGGPGWFVGWVAGLLAALVMLPMYLTPDLMVSCLLVWYVVLASKLLGSDSVWLALGAGAVGGVAFLAKAYALPFVAAQLALTLLIKAVRDGRSAWKGCLKQYAAGLAALLALASPWVAVISIHDGKFTFSSASSHASVWREPPDYQAMPFKRLQVPREGRVWFWENPLELRYPWPTWSPFDSAATLKREWIALRISIRSVPKMLNAADYLGLMTVTLVLSILILFPLGRTLSTPNGVLRLLVCLSACLFIGGYLPNFVYDRYLYPAWSLLLALTIAGPIWLRPIWPDSVRTGRDSRPSLVNGILRRGHVLFVLTLLASMAAAAAFQLDTQQRPHGRNWATAALREAGEQLKDRHRFATTTWRVGMPVAFWAGGQFLGEVIGKDSDDLARQLAPFDDAVLLVVDDPVLAQVLEENPKFRRVRIQSERISAFELRTGEGTAKVQRGSAAHASD